MNQPFGIFSWSSSTAQLNENALSKDSGSSEDGTSVDSISKIEENIV